LCNNTIESTKVIKIITFWLFFLGSDKIGQGEISPSEGETLSKIIDTHSRALEIYDFEKRLKAIEEKGLNEKFK